MVEQYTLLALKNLIANYKYLAVSLKITEPKSVELCIGIISNQLSHKTSILIILEKFMAKIR